MAKLHAFRVLAEMSDQGSDDVWMFMLNAITSAKKTKTGGTITFEVDERTINHILPMMAGHGQTVLGGLLLADRAAFTSFEDGMKKKAEQKKSNKAKKKVQENESEWS